MEDHYCAGDSPGHAVGPRGHGKKQGIVSQNSCLVPMERSVESQSVGHPESGRVSSCHRKVSDSLLWKTGGTGERQSLSLVGSIWRQISIHFPCKYLLLKISILECFLSEGLFILKIKIKAPRVLVFAPSTSQCFAVTTP